MISEEELVALGTTTDATIDTNYMDKSAGRPELTPDNITGPATDAGQIFEQDYNYGQDDPNSPYYNVVPSVQEKNIAKKFARRDRLNLGFTFEYIRSDGEIFDITLFINPEEFNQTEPARITVTQTKGGAFVDHFGRGLKTIMIRGVTGFRKFKVGDRNISGQNHFLQLRHMIRDWQDDAKLNPNDTELRFYNWADEEYFEVAVTNFQLLRNVSRPLLYQYVIQMTCLRDLDEPTQEALDSMAEFLMDGSRRAPLAVNNLEKEVEFVKVVRDKKTSSGKPFDTTGLSSGTQTWGTLIAKGIQYYDTVSGVYKTVESVIVSVDQFAQVAKTYVAGASTFISTPFELVQDLVVSIGNVCSVMCAVEDVPHELVRSFREMICSIQSLPESLFVGFTNPALFEGASNCGTTLGILEAPVAIYDNSFAATVQIPPERQVSQNFIQPQSTLILSETPLKVAGVYLETDVTRSGNNYLDTWRENQVRLTSVPNGGVVVDYSIKQDTVQNLILLETATSIIIKDGDTLERLAEVSYGNPSRWKDIALYNDLEYPFIVANDFQTEIKATGSVRFFRRTGFDGVLIIPKGTQVYVPEYRGTRQINFVTTVNTTLILSAPYVDVPVEAVMAGEIGNVGPGRITGVIPTWTTPSISSVSNPTSTLGGKIWRVMKPGNIILIPRSEGSARVSTIVGAKASYEQLFGIDISLTNGEFVFGNEVEKDLLRVFAVKNLVQALKNRIATRKRFYVYHTEYGTNLPYYIGKKNNSYWEDLVRLDIRSACLLDPRISSIRQFRMIIDGDTISIGFDAIPTNQKSSLPINLIV